MLRSRHKTRRDRRRLWTARAVWGGACFLLMLPGLLVLVAVATRVPALAAVRLQWDWPRDEAELFEAWAGQRYAGVEWLGQAVYAAPSWREHRGAALARSIGAPKGWVRRAEDWRACLEALPDALVAALDAQGAVGRGYRRWLESQYASAEAYNAAHGAHYASFSEAVLPRVAGLHAPGDALMARHLAYLPYRRTVPPAQLQAVLAGDLYGPFLQARGLEPAPFPEQRPGEGQTGRHWDAFVQTRMPLAWIWVVGNFNQAYRDYLAQACSDYDAQVAAYNAAHDNPLRPLDEVTYPASMPLDPLRRPLWCAFTDAHVPAGARRFVTAEAAWRDWLKKRYGTLEAVNAAHQSAWDAWDAVVPPRAEADFLLFQQARPVLRRRSLAQAWRSILAGAVLAAALAAGLAGLSVLLAGAVRRRVQRSRAV